MNKLENAFIAIIVVIIMFGVVALSSGIDVTIKDETSPEVIPEGSVTCLRMVGLDKPVREVTNLYNIKIAEGKITGQLEGRVYTFGFCDCYLNYDNKTLINDGN
jgi:hypothetical protein